MNARIKFSKGGNLKFIGHLDIMRYFQKALRRAQIDVEYSKGFSPHMILSFAAPLGVGLTSDGEYMDMQLLSGLPKEEMLARINEQMARDIVVSDYVVLPDTSKNCMSIVAAADYKVSVKDGYDFGDAFPLSEFQARFQAFVEQSEIVILKKTKKSEKEVNIKPFIYHVAYDKDSFKEQGCSYYDNSVAEVYENGQVVYLQLSTGSTDNLKPELVMEAFCQSIGIAYNPFAFQVHRMEVYANQGTEESKVFVPLNKMK